MQDEEVRHCYWKSSLHVGASLQGLKDYDLLVDRAHKRALERLLVFNDFKLTSAPRAQSLPSTENWVGFDRKSGLLVHLHVHYAIYSGEGALAEVRLPWEDHLLAHSISSPHFGVQILEPALEFVVLSVRAALEKKYTEESGGSRKLRACYADDLLELLGQSRREDIAFHGLKLLGPGAGQKLCALITGGFPQHLDRWLDLVELVEPGLHGHRRWGAVQTRMRYQWRQKSALARAAYRKFAPDVLPTLRRETNKLHLRERGLLIAVIGPDGAGKTTLAAEIEAWLAPHFDAQVIYFGKGDFVSSTWQALARTKWKILGAAGIEPRTGDIGVENVASAITPTTSDSQRPERGRRQLLSDLSRVAFANRLLRDRREASETCERGGFVITDRFPSFADKFADGPGIEVAEGDPSFRRRIARFERDCFQRLHELPPDIVFRLALPPMVAWMRKPDHRLSEIEAKAAALEKIDFGETPMIVIDATLAADEVVREVKNHIWTLI
ncbi:MAG: hypothetical protein H0U74_06865 [Bradymonadaceae bacterium]|nr:hypothetical protein [Lujinxingiaceae bacterium]